MANLKDQQIVEVIKYINGCKHEQGTRSVHQLMELLIQRHRELNDNIDIDSLKENQGMIKAFIRIKQYIESGISIPQNN